MNGTVTLVLGGARSGKSRWAEQLAKQSTQPVLYVATAQAGDPEMAERISVHRAGRPAGWRTLEVSDNLVTALRAQAEAGMTVLVDCLTLWVSNAILARTGQGGNVEAVSPLEWRAIESDIVAEAIAVVEYARNASLRLILVSNEVGLGLVPVYPLGRFYRDILGRVNSALTQHADDVVLMIAGVPVDLRRFSVAQGVTKDELPPAPPSSHWWTPLALAWSFLTVLPSPSTKAGPKSLAAALTFFPVVGILLGALLGALGLLLDHILPAGPIAVLIIVFEIFVTGGLHIDGLMDTADGVFGGRTRERRLEIMRDSRVGSFGASAGALALLAQYACLGDLTGVTRLVALVTALGLGRWAMVVAIRLFPSARASGLGAAFQGAAAGWPLAGAATAAVVAAAVAGWIGVGALVLGTVVVVLGGRFLAGRLGGLTGDTYGALAVVVETLTLFVAVAAQGH